MRSIKRRRDFDMSRYRRKNKVLHKQKMFAGNLCEQVPIQDMRAGDYIVYWDSGWRAAEIKKNHKGYKHRWVRICATLYEGKVLKRSKKIKENQIKEAWRKVEEE